MSLTQERINDIALECWRKAFSDEINVIDMLNLFLSHLRDEQKAVAYIEPVAREHQCLAIVENACCLDDEVINKWHPLFIIPPAASDCKELVEALEKICKWDDHDVKFAADYGSNGVRDYYRNIAQQALAKHKASMGEK